MSARQHTIGVLVQNETGTINRLTSMFRRRGFSLSSFNAGDCEEPGLSRLTIVVNGDDTELDQCLHQLWKLIDVVEVEDLGPQESVNRELALVRVEPDPAQRHEVEALALEHDAKAPSVGDRCIVVELSAEVPEVERFIEALRPYNIVEIVRTGLVAIKVQR